MRRLMLRQNVAERADLWRGYLRAGEITLLTGAYQVGKATLAGGLLRQMAAGGRFLGQPVAPGRVWLFTPEQLFRWQHRVGNALLGVHVHFVSFAGRGWPTLDDWQSLGDQAADARPRGELDLLVVHRLEQFFRLGTEPDPQPVLARLRPFTDAGGAVLLLHGPLKRQWPAYGEALNACVDCVLTMARDPLLKRANPLRLLTARTRRPHTPARLACAWRPATGYELAADHPAQLFEQQWQPLERLLRQHSAGATFPDLWTRWPLEHPRPSRATLYRLLHRAWRERRLVITRRGSNAASRRWQLVKGNVREP